MYLYQIVFIYTVVKDYRVICMYRFRETLFNA